MDVPFAAAANAYSAVQKLMGQAANPLQQDAKAAAQGGDFASLLSSTVGDVLASGGEADQKTMQMVSGNANVVDVVTAISETEIALETLVTVRDKVISAYEEIMRMPI
jgi:flagellar hook-basal body complex protein FliE